MRGADKNAALALRGTNRRTSTGPGRQTRSADATSGQSQRATAADRAKHAAKIDVVPFVPSHSAFCRRAEALLLCGVPFASLAAVLAIVLQRAM
ncbi:hypothetical protein [Shinella pollutisoli]|uniref:Uncharacterized protein n=1 Tax=Shinella pollutisoli TaxID=2250594 RepID=A0ABV7DK05_9HYPH|nr:hypothetical protein [Shinella pollutisoli]